MLRDRLIFGPILIVLLIAGMWADEALTAINMPRGLGEFFGTGPTWPPGVVIFGIMVPVSWLAARELAGMLRAKGILARKRVMSTAALIGLGVSCLIPRDMPAETAVAITGTASAVVLIGSLLFYARNQTIEGVMAGAGAALLAYVYLGLMFGFVLALRRDHSVWLILWILMTTKACDMGAYFTGVSIGKHKLIEWLSPKKTWEGLVGGLIAAGLVGGLGAWALASAGVDGPAPLNGAVFGVLFGLVGQFGDLIASLFKRDAKLKDASTVLPGLGGVLDVLDSPLLVMPVAYWLLAA